MKQLFNKHLSLAALALCTVPLTLFAQKENEKEKQKTERQHISINRPASDEKLVIEIDGKKVKVNGKDISELKDVQVNVNNWGTTGMHGFNGQVFSTFEPFDTQAETYYRVDSNRAMLGVVTEADDRGAEITVVNKESAAEKAGLKRGDVITKIDSRNIDETNDVTDAIRSHKPGDKVVITYLREGKEQKATAELGRWRGIDVKAMAAPRVLSSEMWRSPSGVGRSRANTAKPLLNTFGYTISGRPRIGLSVQDTDDGKGVKVLEVDDDGTAAKAGVQKDDIITRVDDKPVNSADEIANVLKEKKDQPSMRLQLTRAGKTQTIELKVPRKLKTVDL